MITIQGGEFRPIPLSETIDSSAGRGRTRPVDINTESYQVARDYMVRLGPRDFSDDEWTRKLASDAGLTRAEFQARFKKIAH